MNKSTITPQGQSQQVHNHQMRTHQMSLQLEYFNLIKEGIKKIEGRINDAKRESILPGHIIIFKNNQNEDTIRCKVSERNDYGNLQDFLNDCYQDKQSNEVLPGKNISEAFETYVSIYGSKCDLSITPMVGFKLELC